MSKETPKELLTRFLEYNEAQVLAVFAKLPKAFVAKSHKYVYVPGSRQDRILLVAHADTVVNSIGIGAALWIGDVCVRRNGPYTTDMLWRSGRGNGYEGDALGADDRAGCAMHYDLFDGTHSVLITTGEESGLSGARAAAHDIGQELEKHSFAVEVDRRGDRQAVFYNVATDRFKQRMLGLMTKHDIEEENWVERVGSCSDISSLCGAIGICGINLAAGYWNEHRGEEMLMLGAWLHTRTALKRVLKLEKHERFVLPKPSHSRSWEGGEEDYAWWPRGLKPQEQPKNKFPSIPMGVLSKNARKKLAKRVRKLVESKVVTVEQARNFMQQVAAQGNPLVSVSEEQRLGHWLGQEWVRLGQRSGALITPAPRSVIVQSYDVEEPCVGGRLYHRFGDRMWYAVSEFERCDDCGKTALEVGARIGAGTSLNARVATRRDNTPVHVTKQDGNGKIMCVHHCPVCPGGWKHPVVRSGRCRLPTPNCKCPAHASLVSTEVRFMQSEVEVNQAKRGGDAVGPDIEKQNQLFLGVGSGKAP